MQDVKTKIVISTMGNYLLLLPEHIFLLEHFQLFSRASQHAPTRRRWRRLGGSKQRSKYLNELNLLDQFPAAVVVGPKITTEAIGSGPGHSYPQINELL